MLTFRAIQQMLVQDPDARKPLDWVGAGCSLTGLGPAEAWGLLPTVSLTPSFFYSKFSLRLTVRDLSKVRSTLRTEPYLGSLSSPTCSRGHKSSLYRPFRVRDISKARAMPPFPRPLLWSHFWNSRLQLLSRTINRHWDFPDLCSQLHVQDSAAFSPASLGHTALCSR